MTRKEMIEALAMYFEIEPDEETGEYDLNSYDWQAGCYSNGAWMSLANVVSCLKPLCEEDY